MNSIAQMDKIEQFNTELRAFEIRINNAILAREVGICPRTYHGLVRALQMIATRTFTAEDMTAVIDIIQRDDGEITQVDPVIIDRLAEVDEAHRLLKMYAEIHGAPCVESIGKYPVYDWSNVPMIDTVTA